LENKQRSLTQLQSYRLMCLYNYSFLSEKEKQKGELLWEQDEYTLLKNKLHLNKSSAERNTIYEGLVESCSVYSIHSVLENLPLGESSQQRVMNFMDSLQETPLDS